jgi:3',5'-cyclic AMP phosphodiesterase CpdA
MTFRPALVLLLGGLAAPSAFAADIVAAGDIAGCDSSGDTQTAALLDGLPGTILALGDLAYDDGTASDFEDCYEPTWGRHKARTRPAPGNHEYNTGGAAGYYDYFGAAAGDPDEGWYSFDLGGWHIVSLNSNCAAAGGCTRSSPQGEWLAADLAAHPRTCTLAYWHHPRFSSGDHGNILAVRDLWAILDEHDADVVLTGHDHDYERFAPQDADGKASASGLREFVVGTGGRSLRAFGSTAANSEVRSRSSYGVLKLQLLPTSYTWQFVPVAGGSFTDSGAANCVGMPPPPACGLGAELILLLPLLHYARGRRAKR